jgi:hypothetical protein
MIFGRGGQTFSQTGGDVSKFLGSLPIIVLLFIAIGKTGL